jgi:hypothetical protein
LSGPEIEVFYHYDKAEMDAHIIRVSGGLARRVSGGLARHVFYPPFCGGLEGLPAVFLAELIPFTSMV